MIKTSKFDIKFRNFSQIFQSNFLNFLFIELLKTQKNPFMSNSLTQKKSFPYHHSIFSQIILITYHSLHKFCQLHVISVLATRPTHSFAKSWTRESIKSFQSPISIVFSRNWHWIFTNFTVCDTKIYVNLITFSWSKYLIRLSKLICLIMAGSAIIIHFYGRFFFSCLCWIFCP